MYFAIISTIAFSINVTPTSAYSYSDCSDSLTQCQKLTLSASDHEGYSAIITIPSGQTKTIYAEWVNDGSLHGVGFGIYKVSGSSGVSDDVLVQSSSAAYNNGWDNTSVVAGAGQYYLRAVCGGAGQVGCTGSGEISASK